MNIISKIKKIIPKKLFKAIRPTYHFLLAWLSALVYRYPSEKMIVVGVTGTTGKTTTVYMIAKMLSEAGYKTGYTSTAMFDDGEKEWQNDKKMTMIGRFFTQRILRQMVKNDCRVAIVETTSEGVRQNRHRFINYDVLVFTGLYPEHIDSHGGFENYKKAKGRLFSHLKKCKTKYANDEKEVVKKLTGLKKIGLNRIKKTIVANYDDEQVDYFGSFWAEEKIFFGWNGVERKTDFDIGGSKLFFARNLVASQSGIEYEADGAVVSMSVLGSFNIYNSLAAYSVGVALNVNKADLVNALAKVKDIPGRLERIDLGQDFTVIVDYAFEPNAVSKLYEAVKDLPHSQIIHLLGSAGGGRDVGRRPILGKLAGENADFVVVTNEDPYDDDPQIIIDQVAIGAEHAGKILDKNLFKKLDRREGIRKTLSLAKKDDVVLITGKGNEQGICLKDGEMEKWDDREVVKEELQKIM